MTKTNAFVLAVLTVSMSLCSAQLQAADDPALAALTPEERRAVTDELQKWKAQEEGYAKYNLSLNKEARYPRNEAEQASLNAAARKGKIACLKWLNPSVDYSGTPESDWALPGMGQDLVENCNALGRAAQRTITGKSPVGSQRSK